jgi:4-hydroxybutyryl-CoA dehydratase/vinylacetyl-CoA-Delta-isomerase
MDPAREPGKTPAMHTPPPAELAATPRMSAADYRESPRAYRPVVYVDGRVVPRMLHLDESAGDLLNKLEAVRVLCQDTGCAQRYLAHDGLAAVAQSCARIDDATGRRERRDRFAAYLAHVQDRDLALGIAMTDAKGERSRRPHEQAQPDTYVHIVERRAGGIVISGAKAIVTGAPYMHELLVMPCRQMGEPDADFAVCCAVRVDAPGLTIVARPAGRPGEKVEHGAPLFSRRYGQSTAVVVFDRVFVPWERVFLAGEWEHSGQLTYDYATHHRHTCIGARAGFGDLLIGAGALMCEANGLDPGEKASLREPMVELIKITEGFYACGVAASVYATRDEASGTFVPDLVFANIGKLLLATQVYDMHRLAHEVSGGLVVALPGPEEDHNPATAARLADVLRANPAIPYDRRIEAARFIEDLTASYQGGCYSVISLHGGGSPAAMKQEIWRHYPVGSKVDLVERLLERGALHGTPGDPERAITRNRQPGRCCDPGCTAPGQPVMVPLPTPRRSR